MTTVGALAVVLVAVGWAVGAYRYRAAAGWPERALPEVVLLGMLAVAAAALAVHGLGVGRGSPIAVGRAPAMLTPADVVLVGATMVTVVKGVPGAGRVALVTAAALVLTVRLALLRGRLWAATPDGAIRPGVRDPDVWRSTSPDHAAVLRPYPYPVPLPGSALAGHPAVVRRLSGWRGVTGPAVVTAVSFTTTLTALAGHVGFGRRFHPGSPGVDEHPTGFAVALLLQGAVAAPPGSPVARRVHRHALLLWAYGYGTDGRPLPERSYRPFRQRRAPR